MTASDYSFGMGLLWFNLCLSIVYLYRKKGKRIHRYISLLLGAFIVGSIRLLLPIEFPFTVIIRSHVILPALR